MLAPPETPRLGASGPPQLDVRNANTWEGHDALSGVSRHRECIRVRGNRATQHLFVKAKRTSRRATTAKYLFGAFHSVRAKEDYKSLKYREGAQANNVEGAFARPVFQAVKQRFQSELIGNRPLTGIRLPDTMCRGRASRLSLEVLPYQLYEGMFFSLLSRTLRSCSFPRWSQQPHHATLLWQLQSEVWHLTSKTLETWQSTLVIVWTR